MKNYRVKVQKQMVAEESLALRPASPVGTVLEETDGGLKRRDALWEARWGQEGRRVWAALGRSVIDSPCFGLKCPGLDAESEGRLRRRLPRRTDAELPVTEHVRPVQTISHCVACGDSPLVSLTSVTSFLPTRLAVPFLSPLSEGFKNDARPHAG